MFLIRCLLRQLPRLTAVSLDGARAAGIVPGPDRGEEGPRGRLATVDKVAMGPVPVGGVARCRIEVANAGNAPLEISKVVLLGVNSREFALAARWPGVLAPGQRCEVELSLSPRSPGVKSCLLTLVHDGAGGGLKSVLLYGHGSSD